MFELPYVSSQEAAVMLGKTARRINQLVKEGLLAGKVVGNSNVIERASVIRFRKLETKRASKSTNGNGHK